MPLPAIYLQGNLTQDVMLHHTNNSKTFAVIKVACSDRKQDGQGNWTDGETSYFSAILWGLAAENAVNVLKKGDPVLISGKMRQRSYKTKEGEERQTYEIAADNVAANVKGRGKPKPETQHVNDAWSAPLSDNNFGGHF
jgi:single-strand DNA-binding protein